MAAPQISPSDRSTAGSCFAFYVRNRQIASTSVSKVSNWASRGVEAVNPSPEPGGWPIGGSRPGSFAPPVTRSVCNGECTLAVLDLALITSTQGCRSSASYSLRRQHRTCPLILTVAATFRQSTDANRPYPHLLSVLRANQSGIQTGSQFKGLSKVTSSLG